MVRLGIVTRTGECFPLHANRSWTVAEVEGLLCSKLGSGGAGSIALEYHGVSLAARAKLGDYEIFDDVLLEVKVGKADDRDPPGQQPPWLTKLDLGVVCTQLGITRDDLGDATATQEDIMGFACAALEQRSIVDLRQISSVTSDGAASMVASRRPLEAEKRRLLAADDAAARAPAPALADDDDDEPAPASERPSKIIMRGDCLAHGLACGTAAMFATCSITDTASKMSHGNQVFVRSLEYLSKTVRALNSHVECDESIDSRFDWTLRTCAQISVQRPAALEAFSSTYFADGRSDAAYAKLDKHKRRTLQLLTVLSLRAQTFICGEFYYRVVGPTLQWVHAYQCARFGELGAKIFELVAIYCSVMDSAEGSGIFPNSFTWAKANGVVAAAVEKRTQELVGAFLDYIFDRFDFVLRPPWIFTFLIEGSAVQQQRLAASYVAALALYDAANDEASRFDSDLFVEYDVLGARDDEDMRADLRAVAAGATRPTLKMKRALARAMGSILVGQSKTEALVKIGKRVFTSKFKRLQSIITMFRLLGAETDCVDAFKETFKDDDPKTLALRKELEAAVARDKAARETAWERDAADDENEDILDIAWGPFLAEADAALRPMRAGRAVGPVVALAARGDCATCTDLGRATIRCNLAKADATRTCDHAFCYLCFRKSLDREDMRCPVCKIGFAAISNTGPRKTFEVIFHPVEAPEPKTLASKKSRGRSRCGYCKLHDIVSFEHNVSTCPLAPETEPQEKRRPTQAQSLGDNPHYFAGDTASARASAEHRGPGGIKFTI